MVIRCIVHEFVLRLCKKQKRHHHVWAFTCPFDDLPDGSWGGRDHGPLVQAQLADVDDVEAVHVLLRGDGVAHRALIYVGYSQRERGGGGQ